MAICGPICLTKRFTWGSRNADNANSARERREWECPRLDVRVQTGCCLVGQVAAENSPYCSSGKVRHVHAKNATPHKGAGLLSVRPSGTKLSIRDGPQFANYPALRPGHFRVELTALPGVVGVPGVPKPQLHRSSDNYPTISQTNNASLD
jgi:hypothetical protein